MLLVVVKDLAIFVVLLLIFVASKRHFVVKSVTVLLLLQLLAMMMLMLILPYVCHIHYSYPHQSQQPSCRMLVVVGLRITVYHLELHQRIQNSIHLYKK